MHVASRLPPRAVNDNDPFEVAQFSLGHVSDFGGVFTREEDCHLVGC